MSSHRSHRIYGRFLTLSVLVVTLIEAWLARNLSTEFQESEYISRLVLVIVVLVCVGGPVIILSRGLPDACIFIGSAVIFLIAMDVLAMMFLPKIRYKEKKPVLTISGLKLSVAEPNAASFPTTTTSLDGDASDDDTDDIHGDRIIATKDRRELAEEVALLRKLIRAKNRREHAVRSMRSIRNGDSYEQLENGLNGMDNNERLGDDLHQVRPAEEELDITDTTRTMGNLSKSRREQSTS